MEVFKRIYSAEAISDIDRDVDEALADVIEEFGPEDFANGRVTVTVEYTRDE